MWWLGWRLLNLGSHVASEAFWPAAMVIPGPEQRHARLNESKSLCEVAISCLPTLCFKVVSSTRSQNLHLARSSIALDRRKGCLPSAWSPCCWYTENHAHQPSELFLQKTRLCASAKG